MADFKHLPFKTNRGIEPSIRVRFESQSFIEYTVTGSDVKNWVTFPLITLAENFYNDNTLWWIIQDANPIVNPWDYKQGDIIIIPLDFREAVISSTANLESLKRKISLVRETA